LSLMKWGASEIWAVACHWDVHHWGPPMWPLISGDSLLQLHYELKNEHNFHGTNVNEILFAYLTSSRRARQNESNI
jgi:hypothetical protein